MPMRVIAGELRGRPLAAPPGLATRPSAARLRETLFNLLGPLSGLSFLDGFAGSGAVGIEAYSRGARPVAFVESSAAATRVLRQNLERLGVAGAHLWQRPMAAALRALAQAPAAAARGGWDVVFLDPPYADAPGAPLLERLATAPGLLHPSSRLVVETQRRQALPERAGRLRLARVHPQGDAQLAFYRIESEPA
ncbi:MAG: 16S rRNA (guanine(966)-N(2))-methyltransferase RsmD, partial [Terriglobales bacterium]